MPKPLKRFLKLGSQLLFCHAPDFGTSRRKRCFSASGWIRTKSAALLVRAMMSIARAAVDVNELLEDNDVLLDRILARNESPHMLSNRIEVIAANNIGHSLPLQ